MEKEILQIKADISSVKTEIKYLNNNFSKIEELLQKVSVLMEKQSVANNRILNLEKKSELRRSTCEEKRGKIETRIRKLEDWQLKVVVISSVIGTIGAFILNKIL